MRTDVTSAEMIKYASNAFLATKISFINEIANVCEEVGADVSLVADGMGLDQRIGPHFLRPGVGYGGSCFPKDVSALKQLAGNSGYHFQLLTSVIEVNELQKRRVVGKLRRHLGSLRERTVVLLGLAFKPDTNDIREASSLVLAMRLLAEGAHVRAWDPVAIEAARPLLPGVQLCEDLLEAVSGADAAVIVTEWSELKALPRPEVRTAMRCPLIVDGRNFLDPDTVRQAGFTYEGIGRRSSARRRATGATTARTRRSVGSLPRRRAGALTRSWSGSPRPRGGRDSAASSQSVPSSRARSSSFAWAREDPKPVASAREEEGARAQRRRHAPEGGCGLPGRPSRPAGAADGRPRRGSRSGMVRADRVDVRAVRDRGCEEVDHVVARDRLEAHVVPEEEAARDHPARSRRSARCTD